MSYEGYRQYLCPTGHYWTVDCYEVDDRNCPVCGRLECWHNSVDTTNGSWDEEGNRIDGYISLELFEEVVCSCCGHVKEIRYKIPRPHWWFLNDED